MPTSVQVQPWDQYNQTLVANVHPDDWRNPTPSGRYNLVVIGAGSGGLITSLVASSLGAKVALVERHLLGGDCLNVGCVPSKAVIRASRMAHEARESRAIGLGVPKDQLPDFGRVMARMREIRAQISHEDAAARYAKEFGVDVFFGHARFVGADIINVDGTQLRFKRAVISTGARPAAPQVPGLAEVGYLDNETVFTLTELPRRIGVVGSGPIGCELAQAFQRLGAQVTIIEQMGQILTREDTDAAEIVQTAFQREGIGMIFGCQIDKVERRGREKVLHLACGDATLREVVVDEILVAAGRKPNVEDLGLKAVGVDYDLRNGVSVDDHLRTTNKRIYACGDVASRWKFTHAADAAAKIVVQNALFSAGPFGRKKFSKLAMPWCTYTDPEIAHVGLYEHEAREAGINLETYQVPISRANRAVTDGQDEGLVKIHVKKGTDRIVGGTIVASHAGELITQLTLAMNGGIGLGSFTNLIYPYPTQGEAIKVAAGQYTRTRLTPFVKRVFDALMYLRR